MKAWGCFYSEKRLRIVITACRTTRDTLQICSSAQVQKRKSLRSQRWFPRSDGCSHSGKVFSLSRRLPFELVLSLLSNSKHDASIPCFLYRLNLALSSASISILMDICIDNLLALWLSGLLSLGCPIPWVCWVFLGLGIGFPVRLWEPLPALPRCGVSSAPSVKLNAASEGSVTCIEVLPLHAASGLLNTLAWVLFSL